MTTTILGVAAVNRDLIVLTRESVEEYEQAVLDFEEFRRLEAEALSKPHFMRLGGSVVNTLYVPAKCGLDVYIFGKLGADLALWVLTKLHRYNIKFVGVVSSGRTGRTIIFSSLYGKRKIYVYPGVNDDLALQDVESANITYLASKASLVHTSTFVCSHGYEPVKVQIEILRVVKARKSIMLGTLYTSMAIRDEEFRKLFFKLLEQVDLLFLSETELRDLRLVMGISRAEDLVDVFPNIEVVFLTKGEKGVKAIRRGQNAAEFKPLRAEILDTTGAGDAFAGGAILGILLEKDLTTCVKLGLECACACIAHVGGSGYRVPRRVLKLSSKLIRQ